MKSLEQAIIQLIRRIYQISTNYSTKIKYRNSTKIIREDSSINQKKENIMNEFEEWQNNTPADTANENETNEGHTSSRSFKSNDANYNSQRPRRPRFNNPSHGYHHSNEQGFRPEGFRRPDNDYQGGYGQRAQYNNNLGGFDDESHRDGYSHQGGGFGQQRNGYGYQRGGYNQPRGCYDRQRDSYDQQRGGYGQQRGGYNQQHGGYNQQRGGYGQQRGGYGQQRGGYGQQRGGYGQQRNGYDRPHRSSNYDPNAKYSMKKRIEYKEYLEDPNAPIRLNRYLANAGVCSRREADQYIQAGVVKVNGEVITELGTKVLRTDTIHFQDQLVSLEKKVYVLLNKPKDYVTTSDDPQARKTVMDLVKNCCNERIYPVGRLDKNTTGVLLFTNDGDLASKLTHPKFLKQKIYHVFLDKKCSANDLQQIADGVMLEDGEVHADAISYASETDKKQVGIEIHSGKNRIVRRIFESLGYRVVKLDRVMFAGLTKKGLKRGDWRFLTEQEVAMLHMGSYK